MKAITEIPAASRKSQQTVSTAATLWLGSLVLSAVLDAWASNENIGPIRTIPTLLRTAVFAAMCVYLVSNLWELAKIRAARLMALLLLLTLSGFARVAGEYDMRDAPSKLLHSISPQVVFLTACMVGARRSLTDTRIALAGFGILVLLGLMLVDLYRQGALRTVYITAVDVRVQSSENMGYRIVVCAPMLLWALRRRLSWPVGLAYTACILLVMLMGKRGAIVSLATGSAVYCAFRIRHQGRQRIQAIALLIAIGSTGAFFSTRHSETLGDDLQDMWDPDRIGSGRGAIYTVILEGWLDASLLEKIAGRGQGSTPSVTNERLGLPVEAHSDVLELLTELGVLGLAVYIVLWFELLRLLRHAIEKDQEIAAAYAAALAMVLPITLYSWSLHGYGIGLLWLLVGLGVGEIQGVEWADSNRCLGLRKLRVRMPEYRGAR